MDKFLTCLIDDDLTVLIKTGTANKEQLLRGWLTILSEYHELKSDDPNASEHWKLSCKILRLNNHLTLTQHCIDFLSHTHSESIKKDLKRLGYTIKNTSINPDEYRHELYLIVNKAKTKYIEMQQLTTQLGELMKKQETVKHSRTVYDGMLVAFEEIQHTAYSLETVSVSKFIALEKKYNAYIVRLEKQALKYGSNTAY